MPYASLPEGDMFYREKGEGRPALFLHAYMITHAMFADQLSGLSHMRRCIAPDLLNHGRSEPLTEATIDPERDARRVLEFIDALGIDEPIDIVGLSAGGIIAGIMYEMNPAVFSTVTFLSTGFVVGATENTKVYMREMARIAVVEGKDALFRKYDEYIVGPDVSLHARARYKSMLWESRYETIVALLTSDALAARPHIPDLIKAPVLLPYGDADVMMTPETVSKLMAQYADAEAVGVGSAGRLLPLENPTGLNEVLEDFWKRRANA